MTQSIPANIFDACFSFTLGVEGGYSNNPGDPGNWTGGAQGVGELAGTKFGISAAQYPEVDVKNLTVDGAKAIYLRDYFVPLYAGSLAWPLPLVAFDAAVNEGVGNSIKFLQRAAGAEPDGIMGVATMAALRSGDAVALAREALARRLIYLASRPGWTEFSLGWTRRVIKLVTELGA